MSFQQSMSYIEIIVPLADSISQILIIPLFVPEHISFSVQLRATAVTSVCTLLPVEAL